MTDLFEDMFDTAGALNSVDTLTGKNLSELVRALKRIEQQIEDAELHTKSLKAEKHKLSVELIPALMDEMGVERLDVDGVTVSRKMMVHASIPVARREEVYAWLRDNNLDDIIKNDVVVSFGKGEDNRAGHAVGLLQGAGFRP
jgi:hypothetical protein